MTYYAAVFAIAFVTGFAAAYGLSQWIKRRNA